MIKIEPGLSVTTTEDAVSSSAIEELNIYLNAWVGKKVVPPTPPPWEGGWHPVTPAGRISKRISKWARAEMGVKLDKYQLNVIGNNAADLIVPKGTTITITDKFDWDPGDWGDEDSCFFGSKRQTWPMLSRIGGMAALINFAGGGTGRCLILHWQDKPYFFNFYGIAPFDGMALMAAAFDWPMREVIFRLLGDAKDPLYINSSMAFTFDDRSHEVATEFIDMRSDELYEKVDRYSIYCEHCLRKLVDAPRYSDPRGEDDDKSIAYVCQECYPELNKSERKKWDDAYLIPVPLWVEGTTPDPAKKKRAFEYVDAQPMYGTSQLRYQWLNDPAWTPAQEAVNRTLGESIVAIVNDDDIQWEDTYAATHMPVVSPLPDYSTYIAETERQWGARPDQCDCHYCKYERRQFLEQLCSLLPFVSTAELTEGLEIWYDMSTHELASATTVATMMESEMLTL